LILCNWGEKKAKTKAVDSRDTEDRRQRIEDREKQGQEQKQKLDPRLRGNDGKR